MMVDADVVCASPSSVYRTLKEHGLIGRKVGRPSKKGTGFVQPLSANDHWHIAVAYLNISGTFYYLCMVVDGFSRFLVSWDIRQQMTEVDVEQIIQRGLDRFPAASPRIISDNGPQFISKDFKEYVRLSGMTHVTTSPYYPQTNGKVEALNKTVKKEVIRPGAPRTLEEAAFQMKGYVHHYNNTRLHSSIGYITPADKLAGRADEIHKERDRRLAEAKVFRAAVNKNVKRAGAEILDTSGKVVQAG
jgi:transposase InsO family protein